MKASTLRGQVVEICRRLYAKDMIAGADGNVSAKEGDSFWLTPSGAHKGYLAPADPLLVDLEGRVLEGHGVPSSEWRIHASLYRDIPSCRAVVHAHPPWTLALSLSQVELRPFLLSEAELFLAEVVTIPFLPPGSGNLAAAVSQAAKSSKVVILENHGVVTWGADLLQAFNLMECLEHVSKITLLARGMGGAA